MAVEKIHLYCNTSEMPDFALCQRLGLVPMKIDPERFRFKENSDEENNEDNALEFRVNVHCPPQSKDRLHVYAGDAFQWQPIGAQSSTFSDPITPINPDILLMKLAPGQKIDAVLHCQKGIGKDHAKYSPVAACFYRFLTEIEFCPDQQLTTNELDQLKLCFPPGYLDYKQIDQNGYPKIVNPRIERSDLTFQSYPALREKIRFAVRNNTLIFTVESIGAVEPDQLVLQALDVLRSKCSKFLAEINRLKPS